MSHSKSLIKEFLWHLLLVSCRAGTFTIPKFAQNGFKKTVSQGNHLIIRSILNRMGNKNGSRVEAQCGRLCLSGFDELSGGNKHRWYAPPF